MQGSTTSMNPKYAEIVIHHMNELVGWLYDYNALDSDIDHRQVEQIENQVINIKKMLNYKYGS